MKRSILKFAFATALLVSSVTTNVQAGGFGGWNPAQTAKEILDGDIPGAMSGADFRIPNNQTDFVGQHRGSGTFEYRLINRTNIRIRIQFEPSGNVSFIIPGETKNCRSNFSWWGNQQQGTHYKYPVAGLKTPSGQGWGEKITRNGDYIIVDRGGGDIAVRD